MKKLLLTLPFSMLVLASCAGHGTSSTSSSTSSNSTTSSSSSSVVSSTTSTSSSVASSTTTSSSTSTSSSTDVSSSTVSSSSSTTSSSSSSSISSSSSSSTTTSSSSTSSSSEPDLVLPTTVDELKEFVSTTSAALSKAHEASYTFNQTLVSGYKLAYNAQKKVVSSNGSVLASNHISESGTFTKYDGGDSGDNFTLSQTYDFKTYNGLYNGENISLTVSNTEGVTGYINDYASKLEKSTYSIDKTMVTKTISLTKSYFYFLTEMSEPTVDSDGSFSYTLTGAITPSDGYSDKYSYALSLSFTSVGFLKEVRFNSLAYGFNWETNEYNDYVKNSEDTVIVANYSETLTSEIENDLNPGDYLTTSADLYLYDSSSYYEEELDISHVKVGTSIDVKARSFAPSTSLDTKFEIVSSSNTAVVDEKYDSWKAVGVGTTDLTIRTDLGYKQVITVTTYVPAVESISLGRIDELSVGETATLYINTTPNDAVGTFTVTTNVEGIVSISEGYTSTSFRITALKAGIVTITVTCNENTSLTAETSIEVKNKMTDEEITAALVNKTWTCYDYNNYCKIAVVFNSDGTGTVTEADLDPITFNWELVNGNVIVDIFEIYEATYENIRFTINSNVTTLKASQSDTSGWYQIDWTLRVE